MEATKAEAAQLESHVDVHNVVELETLTTDATPSMITPTLPDKVAGQFSPNGSEPPVEDYMFFARGKNRMGDGKIEEFLGKIIRSGNVRRCLRSDDENFFWRATSEYFLIGSAE